MRAFTHLPLYPGTALPVWHGWHTLPHRPACSSALQVLLVCCLAAVSTAPSFGLFAKVKKAEIKYKLLPHLGFTKYNAVRYEPLRESPAAAPYPVVAAAAPTGPYPAADPIPAVASGPYPAAL